MKSKLILYLDTSKSSELVVGLKDEKRQFLDKLSLKKERSSSVLVLIDALLKRRNVTLKDVKELEVERGPGSFTGLRVGVTIANTLGTVLRIPLNGGKIGEVVEPIY